MTPVAQGGIHSVKLLFTARFLSKSRFKKNNEARQNGQKNTLINTIRWETETFPQTLTLTLRHRGREKNAALTLQVNRDSVSTTEGAPTGCRSACVCILLPF